MIPIIALSEGVSDDKIKLDPEGTVSKHVSYPTGVIVGRVTKKHKNQRMWS